MSKVVTENKPKPVIVYLNGDYLSWNASISYAKCLSGDKFQVRKTRKMTLNIQYGNGASVVVRDR